MTVLRGIFLGIVTAALIAFAVGFIGFAQTVHRTGPASPLPDADGIVALTGGSLQRLSTGVRLLEERKGERLLRNRARIGRGAERPVCRARRKALDVAVVAGDHRGKR
jgi:hypothetical protein